MISFKTTVLSHVLFHCRLVEFCFCTAQAHVDSVVVVVSDYMIIDNIYFGRMEVNAHYFVLFHIYIYICAFSHPAKAVYALRQV